MHIELVQVWVFLSFSTWSKILSNIHVCKKIKVNKDFQSWVTSAEAYNYGSIWRESKKMTTVIRVHRYPNAIDEP